MIRVVLPAHLRTLAKVTAEVELHVQGPVTQRSVLDALETSFPMLRGTLRDHVTQQRRPFVRFFACQQDLSHELPDEPLPHEVACGAEPFLVVGAIAGGRCSIQLITPVLDTSGEGHRSSPAPNNANCAENRAGSKPRDGLRTG